jgi:catalase
MTNPSFDNGIPELTEVIAPDAVPAVALPPANKSAAPAFTAPASVLKNEVAQARASAELPDEEWRRLETEVRERIAHQVLGRIDFVLEQRVRDSLADVLQTAVEGLAHEIKQGLQATLEEVIARAVAQEITRLKTTKK